MAEMRSSERTVATADQPESVRVAYVSQDFFSVLGIQPVAGRLFVPEEQQFRAAPTAVVSYSYWQRQLHGARDLETLQVVVSKNPTRIIGVLPPGFHFPNNSDIWIPREIEARLPSRTAHNWQVIGRLRDGATLDQARADISAVAKKLSHQYRLEEEDMVDVSILLLKDALTTSIKPALLVLWAVAGLLLLVAWANVTNLWLAHAEGRAGELAVRAALGASRWRIARQLLAETLLLSLFGACLGIMAAYFGIRILLGFAPADIPRLNEIAVNVYVLLFAIAVSVVVAISLGLFTALRSTWREAQTALVEGGQRQGTGVRSRRTGRVIVAGQVAITLILLTGAGLLGRSMLRVLSIQPGFETEHITTLQLKSSDLTGRTETQRVQLVDQLISRLKTLPGVQEVGGTNALPLKSNPPPGTFAKVNPQQLSAAQRELIERSATVSAEDPDPAFVNDLTKFMEDLFRNKSQTGNADYVLASERYFETLGIPLRSGRLFSHAAGPNVPHEAVISESVAQQTWPNQDPLGKTIEFGNMDGDLRLLTIVGVVGEVRNNLEREPRPTIYVNYRQRPRSIDLFDIVVRSSSDPAVLFGSVRGVLREIDPTIPPRLNTFTEVLSDSVNRRRFNMLLVTAFALTALLLAVAGIFGVLAYSVAQRTREIGLRIALGATPLTILKMVLGQGLVTIGIGTAIGLLGALMLTRTMRSLLFEVSPNDPLTVAGVTLLLILIAAVASYIPAHKATRVDPMVALRRE
jgi:putative ABC transport system permease protein